MKSMDCPRPKQLKPRSDCQKPGNPSGITIGRQVTDPAHNPSIRPGATGALNSKCFGPSFFVGCHAR